MIVEELVANIGLDFKGVDKLEGLVRSFEGFKLAILGVPTALLAASAALSYVTVKTTESVAEMADFGRAVGSSIESLQTLDFVARQNGATFDDVKASLRVLTDTAGNAAKGNESAADAFASIGVAVHNANGRLKTADELLPAVADGLSRMQDPAARLAAAQNLLGRGAVKFLPSLLNGSKGLEEMRLEAERLGLVFDEMTNKRFVALDDAMDMLKERARGVGRVFARAFLPVLEKQVGQLNRILDAVSARLPDIARRIVSLVEGPFNLLGTEMNWIHQSLEGLGQGREILYGLAAGAAVLSAAFAFPAVAIGLLAFLIAAIAEDIDKFTKGQKSLLGEAVKEWDNFKFHVKEALGPLGGLVTLNERLAQSFIDAANAMSRWIERLRQVAEFAGLGDMFGSSTKGQIAHAVRSAQSSPLSNEGLRDTLRMQLAQQQGVTVPPISIAIHAAAGMDEGIIARKAGEEVRRVTEDLRAKGKRK